MTKTCQYLIKHCHVVLCRNCNGFDCASRSPKFGRLQFQIHIVHINILFLKLHDCSGRTRDQLKINLAILSSILYWRFCYLFWSNPAVPSGPLGSRRSCTLFCCNFNSSVCFINFTGLLKKQRQVWNITAVLYCMFVPTNMYMQFFKVVQSFRYTLFTVNNQLVFTQLVLWVVINLFTLFM